MQPFIDRRSSRPRALWRVLITGVFIVGTMQLLRPVIQWSPPAHRSTVTNFALMVVTLAGLWLLARFVDKRSFSDYGLRLDARALTIGSLAGGVSVASVVGIAAALGWLDVAKTFFSRFPSEPFLGLFLSQIARSYFGSVFEEAFSRGVLLKNAAEGLRCSGWSKSRCVWVAYGLSSLLFGLQHAGNSGVTPLALLNLSGLGLLFGAARLWTGDLMFGIGMHAAWNIASANVFGTAADGGAEAGVREVSVLLLRTEPRLPWFGGGYGLEGSALATLMIGSLFVAVVGFPSYRGRMPSLELAVYRSRLVMKRRAHS